MRTTALALSLAGLMAPALARAQTAPEPAPSPEPSPASRTEEWTQRRREQLARLEPYEAGWLERNLLAIEKAERPSILDLNFKGFYPRIQGIASGSRNAIGVRLWQPSIGGSRLSVHGSAFYSLAGYQFYDFQVGRIPHLGTAFPLRSIKGDDVYELGQMGRPDSSRLILYATARHEDYTQLSFYGLGPDSAADDQTDYRLKDTAVELVAGCQFGPHFALTLRPGYLQSRVLPGTRDDIPQAQDLFADATAPGLSKQPNYSYAAVQAFLDYRDEPGNPHRGGMLAIQYSRFNERRRDGFDFSRLGVDARGYLSLGSPQRVLALRAYLALDDAAPGSQVPFYMQEFLGGSHTLRGYSNFRFRGTDLVLLQAEYRWEPTPAIELALFTDAGRVASDASDLDLSGLKVDHGFGIRFKTARAVMMRFDVAWSSEQTRFFLRFSQGF